MDAYARLPAIQQLKDSGCEIFRWNFSVGSTSGFGHRLRSFSLPSRYKKELEGFQFDVMVSMAAHQPVYETWEESTSPLFTALIETNLLLLATQLLPKREINVRNQENSRAIRNSSTIYSTGSAILAMKAPVAL